jgi:dTDP-4-amino-4,6-dideoxygalactose transaminase
MTIPFHRPYISKETVASAQRAIESGALRGDRENGALVEKQLCEMFGAKHALFTTSCSHALELAMMVLKIGPEDEVIMPSFTFASCANAVLLRGGRPVFADIDPRTFNIDVDDTKKKITSCTRAIMPVHYAGIACEMDRILSIAGERKIWVVEDAAQGVDARYKEKYLGTIGDIGCYSFHETKNIVCGEGGAFLTNHDEMFQRAEIIREKGTNRAAFVRGQVDKYTWVDLGSSYVQSDILAAILSQQLSLRQEIQDRRRGIFNRYMQEFSPLEEKGLARRPFVPPYASSNFHIFFLVLQNERVRNHLLSELKDRGIGAAFHYIPLHSSPLGRKLFGYRPEDLPITEDLSKRMLRLPIYPDLTDEEQSFVIEQVEDILRLPGSIR